VDKDIVFGLDARLAGVTDGLMQNGHAHEHDHNHSSEVEVLSVTLKSEDGKGSVDTTKLAKLLEDPTKDEVYRIKGILYASTPPKSSDTTPSSNEEVPEGRRRYILNWAFGRWTFTSVPAATEDEPALRLTIITARYESNKWKKQIEGSGLLACEGSGEGILTVEKIA
jgi:hypothetical protein